MELSELQLDRFLYRDNVQDSATKDAVFESYDSSDDTPAGIPAGGAAQDINTGNTYINGKNIDPDTLPSTVLDVANWGWGQTCAFSSTDADTVSWGAGTFTSADGNSYSISAGNTGNMSAKTYIYLDLNVSDTTYQTTTTSADSVGVGKVLIAVAEDGASSATYNLTEANQIVGDNILANTIDATKMNVGQLSAITANIGSVTSGTITGALIRTSSSTTRVELNQTNNDLRIYNSGVLRAKGYQSGWTFYNSSADTVADIYAGTTALGTKSLLLTASASATGSVYLNSGSSGSVGLYIDGSAYLTASGSSSAIIAAKDILPVWAVKLGDLGSEYASVWTDNLATSGIYTLGGAIDVVTGGFDMNNNPITAVGSLSMAGDIDLNNNDITAVDSITMNGSGSFIENLSSLYLDGRSTNPGTPEGAIWFYDSGGIYEIRTYIGGNRYRFDLTAV